MSSKDVVNQIKNLMVKYGFVDAKLEDGTEIKVDGELAEGNEVVVVTEEAEMPAPDGVHTLEDGTKVETEEGVIVDVEKPEDEESMEDEVSVEVPEEVAPVIDDLVEALLPLLDEVKSIADEMRKMKEKMKSFENEFQSFKKEPAGKKIANGKTDFSKVENKTNDVVENRIKAISSLKNKMK
jgi:ppGpp synthetase/RelA/SpoT-type nucleotidyltranferase